MIEKSIEPVGNLFIENFPAIVKSLTPMVLELGNGDNLSTLGIHFLISFKYWAQHFTDLLKTFPSLSQVFLESAQVES